MKHKTSLEKIAGCLFAVLLALVSIQAQAATDKVDREFNHRNSGYPLTGIHTTTPCESCHIGGVFRGTPRACDGCHAVGTRVSATPKSTKHIVTDAACESCHFNTSTFFGARYNHGTAVRGECTNCHNGRIVEGTPRNHPVSSVGLACDQCHRSTAWIPASWNHSDTASDCSVCHNTTGGGGRSYNPATHMPMSMPPATFTGNCKACHTNYYTFLSAYYNHSGAGTSCQNCHGGTGGTTYTGVLAAKTTGTQIVHNAIGGAPFPGGTTCQSCHTSYASFAGARYNHTGATNCASCHDSAAPTYGGYVQVASTARHTVYTSVGITACSSCHTSTSTWVGARFDHVASTNCVSCHIDANKPWIPSSMSVPPHIPIAAGATCANCHNTSGTTWSMAVTSSTLHNFVDVTFCYTCHGSNTSYPNNRQQTKSWPNFHKSSKNPSATDCSSSNCHKPGVGGKGVLYQAWD